MLRKKIRELKRNGVRFSRPNDLETKLRVVELIKKVKNKERTNPEASNV